jgi:hypothetical protein
MDLYVEEQVEYRLSMLLLLLRRRGSGTKGGEGPLYSRVSLPRNDEPIKQVNAFRFWVFNLRSLAPLG